VLANRPPAALHVTNGDATVPGLRGTGLAERILPWRDVLHEGPVPDVPDQELRRVRAAFLAGEDANDIGTAGEFAQRDRTIEEHRHGEYVLWFEADLYDQLQLVQILAKLHELGVSADRITLISVGEQLSRLPAVAATSLTTENLEHATRAWAALRAPEPGGLAGIVDTPSRELRFVAEAFDRLSREYPSTRDGLSLTERRLLAAVAEGASTGGAAFVRCMAREARPFLGDTWAFDRLTRLAAAHTPLLAGTLPVGHDTPLQLTDTGRDVLDGRADHVALNGIDRWIGGVHLTGTTAAWRWDEGREAIRHA
jgi:hypothetical protein